MENCVPEDEDHQISVWMRLAGLVLAAQIGGLGLVLSGMLHRPDLPLAKAASYR